MTAIIFEQNFSKKLGKIARKQVSYEKENVYDPSLKNEYKQFLEYCYQNKEHILGNQNLLCTVQALIKYNHRYVNDTESWDSKFN
jgi:hypothetical protein